MIEFLYNNAISNNADVSICGWRRINSDGLTIEMETSGKDVILNNIESTKALFNGKLFEGYVWNKLFKGEYFRKFNIRYKENIKNFEETLVVYEIFKHINRAFYSPKPYYNYYLNPNSLTHQSGLTRVTGLSALDIMLDQETNQSIRKEILKKKIELAANVCYSEIHNYKDNTYAIFHDIARKNILFIIFYLNNYSFKEKFSILYSILFPKQFISFQEKYRSFKSNIK
ncbi:hypothetical protein AGMMS49546_15860 [Spirochaetia bacterium]|nr:hypothetical protein AGMMS49546_15860 [Spirochaetia bacterium]